MIFINTPGPGCDDGNKNLLKDSPIENELAKACDWNAQPLVKMIESSTDPECGL